MNRLWAAALEMLYPMQANCMGCGTPLGADEDWLCRDCADMLRPIYGTREGICLRCGRPAVGRGRCPTCGDWPETSVSFARYVYEYRRPAKGIVRRMKYSGVHHMGRWMARKMADLYCWERFEAPDMLAYVPMHPGRERERGFNHARVLCLSLSEILGIPVTDALVRVRNTPQQARLRGKRRRQNLQNAFLAREDLRGKRILLVDDVLTTGSTAVACALALRAAGAIDVQAIAFAGTGEKTAKP